MENKNNTQRNPGTIGISDSRSSSSLNSHSLLRNQTKLKWILASENNNPSNKNL